MTEASGLYGEQEFPDFDALCAEVSLEMELPEHEEDVKRKLNDKIDAFYVEI